MIKDNNMINLMEREVNMKKKWYETPQTLRMEIELEQGILMSASVFEPGKENEDGVSIQGQEIGNVVDFSGPNSSWDNEDEHGF